jgi:hypothetical protein
MLFDGDKDLDGLFRIYLYIEKGGERERERERE